MRKTIFLAVALSSAIILPATAQLGKVWSDFQSYSVDLQNYLRNNLSDFRPLEIQTQGAVTSATGELNIPNPIFANEIISSDIFINSISGNFEGNPLLNSYSVGNDMNRYIIRGSIASYLGRNGQIRAKVKLQNTERELRNIDAFTKESEDNYSNFESDVTSKVQELIGKGDIAGAGILSSLLNQSIFQLKQIKIQQNQSKIIGENLAQTIQGNQFLQYANLNLSSLSQQMEETNRARRVDNSAEAARLLRTTSQIDLFGRSDDN
ncbi:hypothetical protein [Calothrix sp. PCC 6303]|uniref:hypothetical protein n=1 Tax=Calothrix sp. PCC 6303 TaxID=1170562 RepID=UPI0002A04F7D|nr:hypothetical protein [Calothrix sp. PCC 6303]AFZ02058.1 hypothetical protein Cal6303_3113 [Calothrix sp. PCC 6303]